MTGDHAWSLRPHVWLVALLRTVNAENGLHDNRCQSVVMAGLVANDQTVERRS